MTRLKTLAAMTVAAATALSLTACADMYGHHDRYAYGANSYADGYYDDFYGPIDTGYWGDDGAFMYRGTDQQFHRDDAGHFRKDSATGYHTMHAHAGHPTDAAHAPAHG